MVEEQVIADFPKCPWCGKKETITQKAWKLTKGEQDMPFVSSKKDFIPLTDQPVVTALSIPVLLIHHDACVHCGREHITRAEIKNAPITMQMPGGGHEPKGPTFPQKFPFK